MYALFFINLTSLYGNSIIALKNILNKIYMYLPYRFNHALNFNNSLVSLSNLKLRTRFIPLRINIIMIGTFIFVFDTTLEVICSSSLSILFEKIESGFFPEV